MDRNYLKSLFFLTFFALISVFPALSQEVSENQNDEKSSQKIQYSEKQETMRIKPENIRIVPENGDEYGGGGFHLYVQKIPGIESILLTETVKDPEGKNDSYAYRAQNYNPVNGDEIRYLNGKILESEGAKYSLVDSTAQATKNFGEVFHIYIPSKIIYGYEWTRHGEIEIGKGTFINIRTFEKPYADYTGEYMDSLFMFELVTKKKKQKVTLTDQYNPAASEKLSEFSENLIYSKGPQSIIKDLSEIFDSYENKENLDLVLVIDTTGSMKNDLEKLKSDLLPLLKANFPENKNSRVGLLLFRDYSDNYKFRELPVKVFDFSKNWDSVIQNLKSVRIYGSEGGDIPEAIYEAIYAASDFYNWRTEQNIQRQIILITDAEPHPQPRKSGKYSRDFALKSLEVKNITLNTILLPEDK
jgi:Mg-chelatase subunit ChlD